MTFEPALPEEARGDQFETATPADFGRVGVDERGGLAVTPFDYGAVEIHTDGTPTEEPSDAVTVPKMGSDLVPDVFTDENGDKSPERGDETLMRITTTSIPHTFIPPPALTPAPGSAFRGSPEPGADGHAPCGDTVDSSSCGGVPPEGSADGAPPTPAGDTQSSIRTDETEIGGTELSTLVPDAPPPREPTARPQTDTEGSASGEDETSGQDMDPAETPRLSGTLPPLYSGLRSQQPPLVAGAEVTGATVGLPHVDPVTEAGSGAEQLPRQEEASGENGVTLLPDVGAVTSETSMGEYTTQPSFVSPGDKKHPFMERAPTTAPPSQPDGLQPGDKPPAGQATPSYSGLGTDPVPRGALISDPTATGLVHQEILPPLLESQTQTPPETDATKQPEHEADVSLEASTANIKGA